MFESNKEYVEEILRTQVDLQPLNMEFVHEDQLPKDWLSFAYRDRVNAGGLISTLLSDPIRFRDAVSMHRFLASSSKISQHNYLNLRSQLTIQLAWLIIKLAPARLWQAAICVRPSPQVVRKEN